MIKIIFVFLVSEKLSTEQLLVSGHGEMVASIQQSTLLPTWLLAFNNHRYYLLGNVQVKVKFMLSFHSFNSFWKRRLKRGEK